MNEEVKKILGKPIWGCVQNGITRHELRLTEESKGVLTYEICQLFPKTKDNPDGYEPKAQVTRQTIAQTFGQDVADQFDKVIVIEPKPDKGRLLTDIESKLHLYLLNQGQGKGFHIPWMYGGNSQEIVKDIINIVRDLTASEKDAEFKELCNNCLRESWLWKSGEKQKIVDKCKAECQARVERILGKIAVELDANQTPKQFYTAIHKLYHALMEQEGVN